MGERLFGEAGWDPYLEDSATLWILHWQLCRQGSRSSVNHLAFTQWNQSLFSRNELVGWLSNLTNQLALRKVSPASLRRDVDVFIRTYVAKPAGGRVPEDSFDCPLTELGLIDEVDSGIYEIRRRAQPTLQNAVLMYAILDYWHSNASAQATLSFDRIMFGPGSPGGAFQLTEADLEVRLSQLPSHYGFEFDQSAGMRRLVRIQVGGQVAPLDVLAGYYKSRL